MQNAFFEEQEVILQNPKVRSNKQWHECGEAPKKALNGVAVACSGAYCASVCPMGYRSQANWRVKCQDDNTWSKDGFSPCITCPDMSDEIGDLQPTGAQAQNIFVKSNYLMFLGLVCLKSLDMPKTHVCFRRYNLL